MNKSTHTLLSGLGVGLMGRIHALTDPEPDTLTAAEVASHLLLLERSLLYALEKVREARQDSVPAQEVHHASGLH